MHKGGDVLDTGNVNAVQIFKNSLVFLLSIPVNGAPQ